MQSYEQLKKIFEPIGHLQYLKAILSWDEEAMMPEGAGNFRAAALATLERQIHEMLAGKEIGKLINSAKIENHLSEWDHANLRWMEKLFVEASCIPAELAAEMEQTILVGTQAWRKYREQNNWSEFMPYLEKIVKLKKEIASKKAEKYGMDLYDALLDEYAPGFTQKYIDPIFEQIKTTLPVLRREIMTKQASEQIIPFIREFPIEKQKELNLDLMRTLLFDFNHGRLDVSAHPMTEGNGVDVRMTTPYNTPYFT